jgi:hypothetical protein
MHQSPLTYAATPLWAVADPIHCSVTHIQRAETVTDRTLPRCSPLSDVSVSVEQRGKGNKRNLVVWRLTAPLCARAPLSVFLSERSIQVLSVGACRHFSACGLSPTRAREFQPYIRAIFERCLLARIRDEVNLHERDEHVASTNCSKRDCRGSLSGDPTQCKAREPTRYR